jgi:integrase
MPNVKLTKNRVEALRAPTESGKQELHWDAGHNRERGFGVLCSGTTTTKTYVIQTTLKGKGRVRRTIGRTDAIEFDVARRTAADWRQRMANGDDPDPPAEVRREREAADWTLETALKEYLVARKTLGQRSRDGYDGAIRAYLKDWLDRPLRSITPAMVEARHREIPAEIAHREADRRKAREAKLRARAEARGEKYVPSPEPTVIVNGHATANGAMVALRTIWNFAAIRVPDLPPNPVARLKRQWFRVAPRERHVAADDLGRFYAAVKAMKDDNRLAHDFMLLLLFTGLRRSEAAGLTWKEVDLKARAIRLPAARTKAKRRLDLPMSDFVHELLVARRALGRDGDYVFPGDGESGHLQEPKKAFAAASKAAGVKVSPHDLRRTFITVAAGCPMPIFALKGLVNHAVGGDVTGGYAQVTIDMLRAPMQMVGDRLKEYCGVVEVKGENIEQLRQTV